MRSEIGYVYALISKISPICKAIYDLDLQYNYVVFTTVTQAPENIRNFFISNSKYLHVNSNLSGLGVDLQQAKTSDSL